jgi:hypothetical protein
LNTTLNDEIFDVEIGDQSLIKAADEREQELDQQLINAADLMENELDSQLITAANEAQRKWTMSRDNKKIE